MSTEKTKFLNRSDLILIAIIVIIGVGMMAALRIYNPMDNAIIEANESVVKGRAVITVDGIVFREAYLSDDEEILVEDDDRMNVVEIKDGTVRMSDANCPDKACVKQGKISADNQVIVCLPNKVLIKLRDANNNFQTGAETGAGSGTGAETVTKSGAGAGTNAGSDTGGNEQTTGDGDIEIDVISE